MENHFIKTTSSKYISHFFNSYNLKFTNKQLEEMFCNYRKHQVILFRTYIKTIYEKIFSIINYNIIIPKTG